MANWYGAARSNYFRVKDRAAFEAAMAAIEIDVWEKSDDGRRVAICSRGDDGGWPTYTCDEETNEDIEIDLPQMLVPHLEDGEIAVLMCAGAEKLRYISGHANAVHSDGRIINLCLHDIYDRAQAEFGVRPTDASY
jgi:hypothetical protein